MPKRKRPKEDPKKQFERFVETAREHEVDEKDAERRFKKITPSHKPGARDEEPRSGE